MTGWQTWLDHPEKVWLRRAIFQVHFWLGALAAGYVLLMSVIGSVIVYRGALFARGISVEWIVDLHATLLLGSVGRALNGAGGASLVILCLTGAAIWWPGTKHWRRSLRVEWRTSFARINWDLHSALGFWGLVFASMWGVSGLYLALPDQFVGALSLDPSSRVLIWLSDAHFGRFNALTKAVWALCGLAPAVLAFTGMFICCRRIVFGKPSNPNLG